MDNIVFKDTYHFPVDTQQFDKVYKNLEAVNNLAVFNTRRVLAVGTTNELLLGNISKVLALLIEKSPHSDFKRHSIKGIRCVRASKCEGKLLVATSESCSVYSLDDLWNTEETNNLKAEWTYNGEFLNAYWVEDTILLIGSDKSAIGFDSSANFSQLFSISDVNGGCLSVDGKKAALAKGGDVEFINCSDGNKYEELNVHGDIAEDIEALEIRRIFWPIEKNIVVCYSSLDEEAPFACVAKLNDDNKWEYCEEDLCDLCDNPNEELASGFFGSFLVKEWKCGFMCNTRSLTIHLMNFSGDEMKEVMLNEEVTKSPKCIQFFHDDNFVPTSICGLCVSKVAYEEDPTENGPIIWVLNSGCEIQAIRVLDPQRQLPNITIKPTNPLKTEKDIEAEIQLQQEKLAPKKKESEEMSFDFLGDSDDDEEEQKENKPSPIAETAKLAFTNTTPMTPTPIKKPFSNMTSAFGTSTIKPAVAKPFPTSNGEKPAAEKKNPFTLGSIGSFGKPSTTTATPVVSKPITKEIEKKNPFTLGSTTGFGKPSTSTVSKPTFGTKPTGTLNFMKSTSKNPFEKSTTTAPATDTNKILPNKATVHTSGNLFTSATKKPVASTTTSTFPKKVQSFSTQKRPSDTISAFELLNLAQPEETIAPETPFKPKAVSFDHAHVVKKPIGEHALIAHQGIESMYKSLGQWCEIAQQVEHDNKKNEKMVKECESLHDDSMELDARINEQRKTMGDITDLLCELDHLSRCVRQDTEASLRMLSRPSYIVTNCPLRKDETKTKERIEDYIKTINKNVQKADNTLQLEKWAHDQSIGVEDISRKVKTLTLKHRHRPLSHTMTSVVSSRVSQGRLTTKDVTQTPYPQKRQSKLQMAMTPLRSAYKTQVGGNSQWNNGPFGASTVAMSTPGLPRAPVSSTFLVGASASTTPTPLRPTNPFTSSTAFNTPFSASRRVPSFNNLTTPLRPSLSTSTSSSSNSTPTNALSRSPSVDMFKDSKPPMVAGTPVKNNASALKCASRIHFDELNDSDSDDDIEEGLDAWKKLCSTKKPRHAYHSDFLKELYRQRELRSQQQRASMVSPLKMAKKDRIAPAEVIIKKTESSTMNAFVKEGSKFASEKSSSAFAGLTAKTAELKKGLSPVKKSTAMPAFGTTSKTTTTTAPSVSASKTKFAGFGGLSTKTVAKKTPSSDASPAKKANFSFAAPAAKKPFSLGSTSITAATSASSTSTTSTIGTGTSFMKKTTTLPTATSTSSSVTKPVFGGLLGAKSSTATSTTAASTTASFAGLGGLSAKKSEAATSTSATVTATSGTVAFATSTSKPVPSFSFPKKTETPATTTTTTTTTSPAAATTAFGTTTTAPSTTGGIEAAKTFWKNAVIKFFTTNKPDSVPKIDTILQKYDPNALFASLLKKYGEAKVRELASAKVDFEKMMKAPAAPVPTSLATFGTTTTTPAKPAFGTGAFTTPQKTAPAATNAFQTPGANAAPAKPAFGTTATTFGSSFGNANKTTTPSSAFQQKPAATGFGQANTSATSGFGQTNTTTTGGFGSPAKPTSGFGQPSGWGSSTGTSTGFGQVDPETAFANALTAFYQQYAPNKLQNVPNSLQKYKNKEMDMLKIMAKHYGEDKCKPLLEPLQKLNQSRAANQQTAGGFGTSSTMGGGGFGNASPAKPAFGQSSWGSGTSGGFGSSTSGFGQTKANGSGFGQQATTGGFGQQSSGSGFGQQANTGTSGFGKSSFGGNTSGFGSSNTSNTGGFGSAGGFGQTKPTGGAFGQSSGFGQQSTGGFGQSTGFGNNNSSNNNTQAAGGFGSSGGFGQTKPTGFGSGGFGQQKSAFGSAFGK